MFDINFDYYVSNFEIQSSLHKIYLEASSRQIFSQTAK